MAERRTSTTESYYETAGRPTQGQPVIDGSALRCGYARQQAPGAPGRSRSPPAFTTPASATAAEHTTTSASSKPSATKSASNPPPDRIRPGSTDTPPGTAACP